MTHINLDDFRQAALTARKINGDNTRLDITPVLKAADILHSLTKNGVDNFVQLPAATRTFLRGGGDRLGKKFLLDDSKLFHLVNSEIIGNARRILEIDERRLDRTARFFEGVACM